MKKALVLTGLLAALAFNASAITVSVHNFAEGITINGTSANVYSDVRLNGWNYTTDIPLSLIDGVCITPDAALNGSYTFLFPLEPIAGFGGQMYIYGSGQVTMSALDENGTILHTETRTSEGEGWLRLDTGVQLPLEYKGQPLFPFHSVLMTWTAPVAFDHITTYRLTDTPYQTVPDGGATAGLLAIALGFIGFAHVQKK